MLGSLSDWIDTVIVHDWNDDSPSPLSQSGSRLDLLPEQLPEVQALLREGWELAPPAPVWAFLPAVWPRAHRTWVFDRAVCMSLDTEGGVSQARAWGEAEYVERDNDYALLCRQSGVTTRPSGRLWLLRPPARGTVALLLRQVEREIESDGQPFRSGHPLTNVTKRVLASAWGPSSGQLNGPDSDS